MRANRISQPLLRKCVTLFVTPIQIPIPHWCSPGILFECFCEVALGGKAQIIGDEGERFIAIAEEAFCLLYFFLFIMKNREKNKFLSNTCNLTRKVIK